MYIYTNLYNFYYLDKTLWVRFKRHFINNSLVRKYLLVLYYPLEHFFLKLTVKAKFK